MPTDAVFSLGGVRIGFSGRVPPLSDGSFLPQFRAEGAPDVTLELYQDADAALDAPVIYEDSFYRVHRSGERVFAEVSAHGTLPTWGYSVLHCDERRPRLQILSPTCTCTLDQVLSGMMMESLLLARGIAQRAGQPCEGQPGQGVSCRAGSSAFWLTWDGRMLPCGQMYEPAFPVTELGFDAAWVQTRKATAAIRLPDACASCSLNFLCHACAAMCYGETGRFDGKPDYLCRLNRSYLKHTLALWQSEYGGAHTAAQ